MKKVSFFCDFFSHHLETSQNCKKNLEFKVFCRLWIQTVDSLVEKWTKKKWILHAVESPSSIGFYIFPLPCHTSKSHQDLHIFCLLEHFQVSLSEGDGSNYKDFPYDRDVKTHHRPLKLKKKFSEFYTAPITKFWADSVIYFTFTYIYFFGARSFLYL